MTVRTAIPKPPHRPARPWGEWLTGYLFILPAVLVIGIFGLFPIIYALYMSVHRWRIRQGAFLGLSQYEATLGDLPSFGIFLSGMALIALAHWLWTEAFRRGWGWGLPVRWLAALVLLGAGVAFSVGWLGMRESGDARFLLGLTRTFYYGFISVPVQISIALVLATLLFQKIRGQGLFRMLYFLPYVTPTVAAAAVFRSIFSPREERMANTVLSWLGLDPQRWLFETRQIGDLYLNPLLSQVGLELSGFWAGPSLAMLTIIIFGVWVHVGYNTVIFLAGMGGIPNDLYEAAELDGANGYHRFMHITVPMLAPITFYLTVLAFIGTFQAFTHIYVMRDEAIRDAANTASIVIFDTFYLRNDFGLAATQSVVLFLIILGMTLLQSRMFGRRASHGG